MSALQLTVTHPSFSGVVEGLHEAAYKNALCNSLYCPDHMINDIHSEHVSIYFYLSFISTKRAN